MLSSRDGVCKLRNKGLRIETCVTRGNSAFEIKLGLQETGAPLDRLHLLQDVYLIKVVSSISLSEVSTL